MLRDQPVVAEGLGHQVNLGCGVVRMEGPSWSATPVRCVKGITHESQEGTGLRGVRGERGWLVPGAEDPPSVQDCHLSPSPRLWSCLPLARGLSSTHQDWLQGTRVLAPPAPPHGRRAALPPLASTPGRVPVWPACPAGVPGALSGQAPPCGQRAGLSPEEAVWTAPNNTVDLNPMKAERHLRRYSRVRKTAFSTEQNSLQLGNFLP